MGHKFLIFPGGNCRLKARPAFSRRNSHSEGEYDMLRKLLAGAATSAMILVSAGAVKAADMIEPEAAMFDWSGFYLGVHGGYGWANFEGCHECDESSSVLDADDLDVHGPLIGVHGGFNVQSGAMVFGMEGAVSFT